MDVRAITFDCYGTLIDWEAGIFDYVDPLLQRSKWPGAVTTRAWIARWEEIQFGMLTPYRPYREILAASYDATMREFGLEAFLDAGPGLAHSVGAWRPFSDVTAALRRLAKRYRLGIISNIDRDLIAASLGHLQAPLSMVVTAEEAQAYKPDVRPFELAIARLHLPADQILHAAFGWKYDLAAARAVGLRTAFINRSGGERPDGPVPDLEVASVAALADALGA